MANVTYRPLTPGEITRELFSSFIRHQTVTQCLRKIDGKFVPRDISFVDDWTEDDYRQLITELRETASTCGVVIGAFVTDNGSPALKGFASLAGELIGSKHSYADLTNIYVSEDYRRNGIGAELFSRIKACARAKGAEKLYISAHSAVESQAFYASMGCTEAEEYSRYHAEKEPCDCQMECGLG